MVVVPKSSKCLRASEVSLLRQFLAKDLRDDLFYQVFEQWSGLRATTKASLARLDYRVYNNKRYYLEKKCIYGAQLFLSHVFMVICIGSTKPTN